VFAAAALGLGRVTLGVGYSRLWRRQQVAVSSQLDEGEPSVWHSYIQGSNTQKTLLKYALS